MPKKSAVSAEHNHESDAVSFEEAYRELTDIVATLERGDLALEQALELHARGQRLVVICSTQLEQAELKIKKLGVE